MFCRAIVCQASTRRMFVTRACCSTRSAFASEASNIWPDRRPRAVPTRPSWTRGALRWPESTMMQVHMGVKNAEPNQGCSAEQCHRGQDAYPQPYPGTHSRLADSRASARHDIRDLQQRLRRGRTEPSEPPASVQPHTSTPAAAAFDTRRRTIARRHLPLRPPPTPSPTTSRILFLLPGSLEHLRVSLRLRSPANREK